jgi:predicted transcriptional regulator
MLYWSAFQMDLSQIKLEVLEALLVHQEPVKADQVAKEMGKERPAIQMHLIGLTKAGYAQSPLKGQYQITNEGKKALGLNEIDKEKASTILAPTVVDKAFHFYCGIGKPLNIYAHNLQEFCDKIDKVPLESLEFHSTRGDFESWFVSLGDLDLAKKAAFLRESNTKEKNLSLKLREIVENRCKLLLKISNSTNLA